MNNFKKIDSLIAKQYKHSSVWRIESKSPPQSLSYENTDLRLLHSIIKELFPWLIIKTEETRIDSTLKYKGFEFEFGANLSVESDNGTIVKRELMKFRIASLQISINPSLFELSFRIHVNLFSRELNFNHIYPNISEVDEFIFLDTNWIYTNKCGTENQKKLEDSLRKIERYLNLEITYWHSSNPINLNSIWRYGFK